MSSIFDDKRLIDSLIKSAVEHDFKFNKKGQGIAADPNINAEFKNYLNLTMRLANQLQESYSPTPKDKDALGDVSAKGEAGLGVADMNSLGNFFDALVRNEVTVNGERIAYSSGEEPPNRKTWLPVDAERSQLLIESMDEQGNRKAPEGSYYVNPTVLTKYITTLNATIAKEEDEQQKTFMKTMLGSLLEKINRVFRTKLTTDYKEPEKKMAPGDELTRFPQMLDYKKYNESGNIILTWGDLASADALKGWVSGKNITLAPADAKSKPLTVNDTAFDMCTVVRVIYAKATWLQRTQPDPDKKIATFVAQITKIGPTLQSPDGKACTLTAGQGDQPGQQPGGQPGGAAKPVSQQQLHSIVQYMPLDLNSINFQRISAFFRAYEQVASAVGSSQYQAVQGYKNVFNQAYTDVKNLTLTSMDVFPLGVGADAVFKWLKQPQNDRYLPFVQKLEAALDATNNAITLFYNSYVQARSSEDRVIFNAEEKEIVESQILGDSIYQNNTEALARWKNAQDEIAGFAKK